jgi:predicted nucleotidyltransferase
MFSGTEICLKDYLFLKKGRTKIAIFGFYTKSEARLEREINILVEFSKTKNLLILVGIERERFNFLYNILFI